MEELEESGGIKAYDKVKKGIKNDSVKRCHQIKKKRASFESKKTLYEIYRLFATKVAPVIRKEIDPKK